MSNGHYNFSWITKELAGLVHLWHWAGWTCQEDSDVASDRVMKVVVMSLKSYQQMPYGFSHKFGTREIVIGHPGP